MEAADGRRGARRIVPVVEEGGHTIFRMDRGEPVSPGFIGEFMGTTVMILLGNGVVANVLLRRTKAEGAGWMVITTGWAFAVMIGVFTAVACGSHEAHLNPAVTLGMAIVSGDYSKVALYVPAQLLGAMAGAVLVWLH